MKYIPGPGPGLGTGPHSRRHVYPREGSLLPIRRQLRFRLLDSAVLRKRRKRRRMMIMMGRMMQQQPHDGAAQGDQA